MLIREARGSETEDVLPVHRLAFAREDEALLVSNLLRDPTAQPVLSMVAVEQGRIIGHVLFTAASLTEPEQPTNCALLAPLAVLPSHQRSGVGRALIEHGCELLSRRGVVLVFVLGDPRYYGRCGFGPAHRFGLKAPYPIEPQAAWMVRTSSPNVLGTIEGTVRCAASLAAEQYWRE